MIFLECNNQVTHTKIIMLIRVFADSAGRPGLRGGGEGGGIC